MPAYRAVLFDFFGTLTQSVRRGPQHDAVADALGCDPEALVGVLDRSFRARARGLLGSPEATLRWVGEQAGGSPGRAQLKAAFTARVAALRHDTRLRPDAVPVLQTLRRRGVHTAVVSDCTHELPVFLPQLPVAPLLEATVYSVEVGQCKPHPVMYLSACQQLGVSPQDCLYVGDGGSRELTGATDAGLTAVRLDAADLHDHLVFDADVTWAGARVDTLSQVLDLVDHAPALL